MATPEVEYTTTLHKALCQMPVGKTPIPAKLTDFQNAMLNWRYRLKIFKDVRSFNKRKKGPKILLAPTFGLFTKDLGVKPLSQHSAGAPVIKQKDGIANFNNWMDVYADQLPMGFKTEMQGLRPGADAARQAQSWEQEKAAIRRRSRPGASTSAYAGLDLTK